MLFSSPQEQARIAASFLHLGLTRGERCIFVGSPQANSMIEKSLGAAGVDVPGESQAERLVITSDRDYLDGGRWSTEKMLGFLENAYESAIAEGFSALRAVGDVSWQVGPDRDFSEIVRYEALLDLFFNGKRMTGICQYPKENCPVEILNGILDVHPIVAIDASVGNNVHYVPAEILVEPDTEVRKKKRFQWLTSQILRLREAELARDKAMQALRREKEELQRVVAEKDRLQEQLLQAQKMEAIGRLAGGIAHDFNNLLTVVLSLVELILADEALPEASRSDVREIKLAGERAATLTRHLLAFSRRQVLKTRVFNLNDLLRDMEPLLRRMVGEMTELRLQLAPRMGNIKADPGQIEQVVMNLAVNAKDAMPNGGALTIETGEVELGEDFAREHPGSKPGSHAMIAVSDTGTGMPLEVLKRLFEPFFTTKEKGRGTGLGLASAHGIVKQSGGSLFAYSEPGKGSSFKVYLPLVDEPAEAASAVPARSNADSGLQGTETVLLVEDEDQVRKLTHRTLAERGYTVLSAMSPQEAVKFCERHRGPIDLIVADIALPRMTGPELLKRVLHLRPKMKALFMSGYAANSAVERGLMDEESLFIEKPFTPLAFAAKVREILDTTNAKE